MSSVARLCQFSSVLNVYTFSEGGAMTRLTRWGNSDGGLRIPKSILEAAGLHVGDEIGCRLRDDGTIVLTPCKGGRNITLETASYPSDTQLPELKW
ncbi:AbrB/MazE/SpoVT family DNA-binding domain-containing protein [Duganella aquatilis]|uniref:AbrB/MazE/SpoVT family DNA-binding domain-containing protein n=1 Tax=Duganella aquatilis TaxID=2666082 RepID=UPI00353094C1